MLDIEFENEKNLIIIKVECKKKPKYILLFVI